MSSLALKGLDPTEFENLIFDLMALKGLQNVRWRTPGADGGRDIEADEAHIDIANTQIVRKWYVECKKYRGSVDWPTIFSKIAYAESQSADYLLMCTSAKFTPAAITQMELWNQRRGSVQVRLWPGHEIEHQMKPFFDLRTKYGIDPALTPQGPKLAKLSLAVSQSIQTYYGKLIFTDAAIDPMVSGAQAIALLIQQRLKDLESFGSVRTALIDIRSVTDYPVISDAVCQMDQYSYVALLAYHYALSQEKCNIEVINDRSCRLRFSQSGLDQFCRYQGVFEAILFWGDIEWSIDTMALILIQRMT